MLIQLQKVHYRACSGKTLSKFLIIIDGEYRGEIRNVSAGNPLYLMFDAAGRESIFHCGNKADLASFKVDILWAVERGYMPTVAELIAAAAERDVIPERDEIPVFRFELAEAQ